MRTEWFRERTLVTLSGGRGNGTLRLRNQGLYFLFIFLFVAYILSAGHTM